MPRGSDAATLSSGGAWTSFLVVAVVVVVVVFVFVFVFVCVKYHSA